MDETNIPLECGIESRAIVTTKAATSGRKSSTASTASATSRANCAACAWPIPSLELPLPQQGDKLFHDGKEVGYVTSAVKSPALNANIALGYVRREANQIGNELMLQTATGESPAKIVELPFMA